MFEYYSQHDVAVYGGFINDETKLMQSTSGGIATALSEYIIEHGGYVAGVAYSDDFYKAEYVIVHNLEDIGKLKGSKYIDCDKNNVYNEVKDLINAGKTVLFFGLPCIVAALYASLKTRPENLITCELICHGPTSAKVHSDYVKFLEKKYKSKVVDFEIRHKSDVWIPSYTYARFENGKTFKKLYHDTEYGYAFTVLGKAPCYNCKFKGNNRQGDIMLGDYWGVTESDPFWNIRGVSAVFAETDKGNDLLRSVSNIVLHRSTFENAVRKNPMVIRSRNRSGKEEVFSELLEKKGLMYAVKHTMSFKTKVYKTIMAVVPSSLKPKTKKMISRLRHKD